MLPKAINQPLPSGWHEKHDRLLFQRETRSKTAKFVKTSAYLEHYSVVKLNKKKKSGEVVWKEGGHRDSGSEDEAAYVANLTDNSTYARSLGFFEPLPEFVSHLEEADVQERLNRSLPVSLWAYLFQPIVKFAQCLDE